MGSPTSLRKRLRRKTHVKENVNAKRRLVYATQDHHANNALRRSVYASVDQDANNALRRSVEFCASVQSVKYLHKYIYKGHDRASLVVEDEDEIAMFIDGRYISTSEATWRIFGFDLHNNSPSVIRLQVHLPEEQSMVFNSQAEREDLEMLAEEGGTTTLTAWLEANVKYPEGRHLLYSEYVEQFVYKSTLAGREWCPRKRNVGQNVGRMYFVPPSAGERYFLRLLLNHVSGATSFQDLRTYNGVVHPSFHEACRQRGLLNDDTEWNNCLREAALSQSPTSLRRLFVTILEFNSPQDPYSLWCNHKASMLEDIIYQLQQEFTSNTMPSDAVIENMGLWELEQILRGQGKSLQQFSGMPMPTNPGRNTISLLRRRELDYDRAKLTQRVACDEPLLNKGQQIFYSTIVSAMNVVSISRAFFLQSAGGCGKTFVLNLLVAYVRSQGYIALAMATSGIASLLLDGGTTAHSRMGIPTAFGGYSSISKQSERAAIIREANIIIWDEAPMAHKDALRVVDELLRDLMDEPTIPFGGKLFVASGDWRQILPVVKRGNRAAIINATWKRSYLWKEFQQFVLTENVRVQQAMVNEDVRQQAQFANWLLQVGDGTTPNPLPSPTHMVQNGDNCRSLVDAIFSAGQASHDRCILTPKNETADTINALILESLPGDLHVYESADYFGEDSEAQSNIYPNEFLNTLLPSGMPQHRLNLKVGAPIILIRNLNRAAGLMNGTRLSVTSCLRYTIQATVLTGTHKGNSVCIPRINLTVSDDDDLPIKFIRRQFPVKLAFCMTINKSQGQTFSKVGLLLATRPFSHGQVYVALSRCGNSSAIKVWTAADLQVDANNYGVIEIIVWPEILD